MASSKSLKYILLVTTLFISGCQGLLFYPSKEMVRTPADVDLTYDDIYLESLDGTKLNGWFLMVEKDVEIKGTVYFLHGNAQNISHHLASVYWLPEQGYQVFLLDYRGYGNSAGTPLLSDVLTDINSGFEYISNHPKTQNKPLYLLGQSLGASMSGYLVGSQPQMRDKLSAVILDAAFSSYADASQHVASQSWITWLFQYPVAWSMPDNYDLIDVVDKISPTPLLIIHGKQDNIISYQHSQVLLAKAKQPKALLSYNGGHIATFNDVGNQQLLVDFMQRYKKINISSN
ncbi:alpha/beta hydrolase [Thalassotalea psychrophila]|uniref:Alpha/beta hydrolase n=1 Tax=Thalassotalea psychrophila TaxID=3065647 RepID=A0ABY9TQ91_9GAMM|nr:alpha/beta hydrolase [Colwelliaceae bacterium SQ149]